MVQSPWFWDKGQSCTLAEQLIQSLVFIYVKEKELSSKRVCRIIGISNLWWSMNSRVLIAVLLFPSLYPGAFMSKAVKTKDAFLLS